MADEGLLLINPRNPDFKGVSASWTRSFVPLGLGVVAALTPAGRVTIADENFSTFKYREAHLAGLTSDTASVPRAYEIASFCREKGVHTVIGGLHASMLSGEALRNVDTVVSGEAEGVWPRVLLDFESGGIKSLYEGGRADLKGLPGARHDLLDRSFFGVVQTSRGCPMGCDLRSVTRFDGGRTVSVPSKKSSTSWKRCPRGPCSSSTTTLCRKGSRSGPSRCSRE